MIVTPSFKWISGNPLVAPGRGIDGRGVIALARIEKGQWFDCAPVLVLPERELARQSLLNCYVYFWTFNPAFRYALAFGMGSLYNHSRRANAAFRLDYKNLCICYQAQRDIESGEEIFIDYDYDDEDLVGHPELDWFRAANAAVAV